MRAKLVLASVLICNFNQLGQALELQNIPKSAAKASELRGWADSQFGSFSLQAIEASGKSYVAILRDSGSGTTRSSVLIYLKTESEWKFMFYMGELAEPPRIRYSASSREIHVETKRQGVVGRLKVEAIPTGTGFTK